MVAFAALRARPPAAEISGSHKFYRLRRGAAVGAAPAVGIDPETLRHLALPTRDVYQIFEDSEDSFDTDAEAESERFRKKYEAVIANNQSLLDTYKINLKYSEEPVYTFKNIVAFSPVPTATSCIPPNRLP